MKRKPPYEDALMEADQAAFLRRLRRTPEAPAALRRSLRHLSREYDRAWTDERVFVAVEQQVARGGMGMWLERSSRESVDVTLERAVKLEELEPPEKVKDEVELHWIEIVLLGEDDEPIPGEKYQIELPDGTLRKGSLDAKGSAYVGGLEQPGNCQVTFPELDQDAWEAIA